MTIQEFVPLAGKTTMRIGGKARYYADLETKEDVEGAIAFAKDKGIPLIIFGNAANTIFADEVEALVVRLKSQTVTIDGNRVTVECGKNLPMLINELAKKELDLSALTGIPGTVGGAIFGNAGQGPLGIWIDSFVREVSVYVGDEWKTFTKEEGHFRYRESIFKEMKFPVILWQAMLELPTRSTADIEAEVQKLLQKRIETQPHLKTAGSCFKAVGDTPAWKLIDAAGLRGFRVGDVQISEKHANFLLNVGSGTYSDAKTLVQTVKEKIPEKLEVEMRFIEPDGSLAF